MKVAAIRSKVWALTLAAAGGWAAAVAATLPMQFYEIVSNAVGGWRPLLWSLGAGTLVWFAWTLSIAAWGWLAGGLPVALLVPEGWLLANRSRSIAISAALGWVVVLVQFRVWKLFLPDETLNVWLFTLYSILLLVFSAVTAAIYLRMRRRKAEDG